MKSKEAYSYKFYILYGVVYALMDGDGSGKSSDHLHTTADIWLAYQKNEADAHDDRLSSLINKYLHTSLHWDHVNAPYDYSYSRGLDTFIRAPKSAYLQTKILNNIAENYLPALLFIAYRYNSQGARNDNQLSESADTWLKDIPSLISERRMKSGYYGVPLEFEATNITKLFTHYVRRGDVTLSAKALANITCLPSEPESAIDLINACRERSKNTIESNKFLHACLECVIQDYVDKRLIQTLKEFEGEVMIEPDEGLHENMMARLKLITTLYSDESIKIDPVYINMDHEEQPLFGDEVTLATSSPALLLFIVDFWFKAKNDPFNTVGVIIDTSKMHQANLLSDDLVLPAAKLPVDLFFDLLSPSEVSLLNHEMMTLYNVHLKSAGSKDDEIVNTDNFTI